MPLTQVQLGMQGTPQFYGFKNRIINGGMVLDQRNAGAAVTINAGALYTVDRWLIEDGCDAVLSAQQSTDVPSNGEFVNSLRVTATTADATIGATQYAVITQFIEGFNTADLGWGTANAKTVTVSFWVKASVAGQYSCTVYNNGASRINPQPFTINSANTWEYKTITIAGDTTGTWLTNNGRGIVLNFYMALGSSFLGSAGWNGSNIYGVTGQANALASTNNIFAITGVQLEVGVTATSFDFRSIGQELALAQRYFQRDFQGSLGQAYSSSDGVITLHCAVPMRINPVLSQASGVNITIDIIGGTQNASSQSISGAGQSPTKTTITVAGLSGRTTWQALAISNTGTQLSAEF